MIDCLRDGCSLDTKPRWYMSFYMAVDEKSHWLCLRLTNQCRLHAHCRSLLDLKPKNQSVCPFKSHTMCIYARHIIICDCIVCVCTELAILNTHTQKKKNKNNLKHKSGSCKHSIKLNVCYNLMSYIAHTIQSWWYWSINALHTFQCIRLHRAYIVFFLFALTCLRTHCDFVHYKRSFVAVCIVLKIAYYYFGDILAIDVYRRRNRERQSKSRCCWWPILCACTHTHIPCEYEYLCRYAHTHHS